MSDKYEKAAREFLLTENEDETDWNFSYDLPRMMRAFRWYEEKYLADALTAAAMMMNKPPADGPGGATVPSDKPSPPVGGKALWICPNCGVAYVVAQKVQPPEGGGDDRD